MDEALNPPLNPDEILDKALAFFLSLFLFCIPFMGWRYAQILAPVLSSAPAAGPIAIDGSACTNTAASGVNPIACSSSIGKAGDAILTLCFVNGFSFDPGNPFANDPLNGVYDTIQSNPHPQGSNDWLIMAVKTNIAGATTPQCTNWENNGWGIWAAAFSNVRTDQAMDGGAINQFRTTTGTNPTSSTSTASPSGNNELLICQLVRASALATTAGTGWTPSGTLTAQNSTLAQYVQYMIQTTAAAQNCPFTSASGQYTNGQAAFLQASSSAGYKALTGSYGWPSAAQTNGASATPAILNTTSGSLNTLAPPTDTIGTWWSLRSGSGGVFDTSISCTGSLKLIANGIAHTFGDANTMIKVASGDVTTAYQWDQEGVQDYGTGGWLGQCFRIGTDIGVGQGCDTWNLDSMAAEGAATTQLENDSSGVVGFRFEINSNATPTSPTEYPATPLNKAQNYIGISHYAGVGPNDTLDDIYILGETTPGTLPWTVFGHMTWPRSGPAQGTATATAVAGSTSITVASSTIQPFIGQNIWSATGGTTTGQITPGVTVTSVSGTCSTSCTVGISGTGTLATMSATPILFTGPKCTVTGSVTAGSTSLTVASASCITAGGAGTGYLVGMLGVSEGTWVAAGSGTSWTLSMPATQTQTNVLATFWTPQVQEQGFHFAKYSSCNSTATMWFGQGIWDPYGLIWPKVISGALPL